MKLWGYYAVHTFVNSIKKMFRSTFVIIMAVAIGVGLIFGASVGVITSLLIDEHEISTESGTELGETEDGFYDKDGNFYSNEEAYLNEEGEVVFFEDEVPMTQEEYEILLLAVESIAGVIILAILFTGAYSGMKKGSDIFTMADVNFLFTAPMKPQSVLLFRLTFQMITIFAGSIYILFQIPNLVLNVGVPLYVCLIGFGTLMLALIYQKLLSVGMYTLTATHPKVRKYVLPGILVIVGCLVATTGAVFLSTGQDLVSTMRLTWASGFCRWIPVVGWLMGMLMYAIEGNVVMLLVAFMLLVLCLVFLTYIVWHMKADFYEDALEGAQKREDMLIAAAEKRKPVSVSDEKEKKKDKRKVTENQSIQGAGAYVFFSKEVLCRKRMAKFGFVSNTMIWYLLIVAAVAVLNLKVFHGDSFDIAGFVIMVVLFFRNYGNPIAQETSMNWLFLVPESPYKKVFFAMLAGSYATFMDLVVPMVLFTAVCGTNLLYMLLWLFVLLTMDFMLSGVGMVLEAIFPADAMNTVKASLQLMLKFFMIFVIVIVIVIGVSIQGLTLGLILNLIMNIILGAIAFIIYPSVLHGGIA